MGVKPSPQQLAWQEAETSLFLHFGMNTFTDREWGDGTESPTYFNPAELDARQWVRVAKENGFRYVILTAKHHDGFCLWPSAYTEHSVKNSPWRGGKGDVVRDLGNACRDAGIKLGIYLSPWDRHERTYGNSPVYNRFFKNQLTELLTHYGPIAEVWFDGACGEGPNGRRQEYDWQGFYRLIKRLQPDALVAICGPDIRWVGNEDGFAEETEWSVQEPTPLYHGEYSGPVWYPAECDVSIRPGWFWHRSEDPKVKSVEALTEIWYGSVGRNATLLLNVPPNDRGLISEVDEKRLSEFRAAIDSAFEHDLAHDAKVSASAEAPEHPAAFATDGDDELYWTPGDVHGSASIEVDLGRQHAVNAAVAQEFTPLGQRVESYRVEYWSGKGWKLLHRGTTIGHRKVDVFDPVRVRRVRLTIAKSTEPPLIRSFGLYRIPTRK